MSTLFEKLKEDNFTIAEKNVTNFILKYPEKIIEMNVRKLADETYTSTATIIRICHKLGYKGFKDFHLAFILELENKKYENNYVEFNRPFHLHDSNYKIVQNLANLYQETVRLVMQSLDIDQIELIAKELLEARRIFIYASGDTQITATRFCNRLMKLNIYPIDAYSHNEALTMYHNISKQDIVLFISYKGLNENYLTVIKTLNKKSVRSILITSNHQSPLLNYSYYHLFIPSKEGYETIGSFYSQTAIDFILNIIYSLIYNKNYEKNHKHKELIDKAGLGV